LFPLAARVPLAAIKIGLTNFRSYTHAMLDVEAAPIVLFGANGTGKTNLLEAISLFSPGRGLRGAKLTEVPRKPATPENASAFATSPWALSISVQRPDGVWDMGTGLIPPAQEGSRASRVLHLNGAPATSGDVTELLPMLWLTPALDRLFLEGASERRRFLD